MSSESVRISAAGKSTRRRPRQSRAQASSQALQDAFVRVLLARGAAGLTVREVAAVAGVGIGTFYDNVANMRSLAALTIHRRVQALALGLASCAEQRRGRPLRELLDALLDYQLAAVRSDAVTWAALLQMERQVTEPAVYARNHEANVLAWGTALGLAADPPRAPALQMLHMMVYGCVSQALLTRGASTDWDVLRVELGRAVHAYLQAYLAAV